jgi:hypothetical protein
MLIEWLVDRTLQNGGKAGRFESPEQFYAEYLSTLTTDAQYPHEMKRNLKGNMKVVGVGMGIVQQK